MSDAQRFWLISFCAQEGAYPSRCQMPVIVFKSEVLLNWDGLYIGDHTNSFGSIERNRDVDVLEGRYCGDGEGGVSNFITGDNGTSFLILFTPFSCHS